MRVSMTAIVVVVVFAVVLFGAKRLPELARSLGQSLRILKSEAKAMRTDGEETAAPPPAGVEGGAGAGGTASGGGRVIQSAPGATSTARPVAGPEGDRPH
ncbi:Sec-independent protein translocase subunit TatA [Streptomyces rubellomurinus]|uniref:Sec-independent protein translocase protein TatA n=1 Tax=Streptomyces sp. Y1 TaxID=3238634 RepID=A0AB39TRY7_9ACTN|nr:hypothetical protein VM98_17760 [Streptomyces rubellomurinus subsp. indigoferus]